MITKELANETYNNTKKDIFQAVRKLPHHHHIDVEFNENGTITISEPIDAKKRLIRTPIFTVTYEQNNRHSFTIQTQIFDEAVERKLKR